MGLNVSASMNYNLDYGEILRSTARNILNRSGASTETTQKIIESTLFNNNAVQKEAYTNSSMSVLMYSTQITLNESLKETLKYLKEQSNKKVVKEPVLGELWDIFNANNELSEKNPYKGELCDFEVDKNARNIFAD